MLLTITRFLDLADVADHDASERLAAAIPGAVTDSTARVGRTVAPDTVVDHDTVALTGGGTLDGTTVRVFGQDRLTTLEVKVPWTTDDRETTALAADAFAGSLTRRLRAA